MGVIIQPKRWSFSKPPPGCGINPGHPLAQGLVGCWNFSEGGGVLVRNAPGLSADYDAVLTNTTSDITWVPGKTGIALQSVATASSSNRVLINAPLPSFANAGVTTCSWETLIRFDGSDGYGAIFTDIGGTFGAFFRSTSVLDVYCADGDHTSAALTAGSWYHIVVSLQGGNGSLYINGVKDPVSLSGVRWLGVGASVMFNDNASETAYCACDYQRFWTRSLSQGEILQLFAEPYCFMQPQSPQRRYWFAASATVTNNDPPFRPDRIEMSRYSAIDQVRLIPGAIPRFEGATIQRTDPIAVFGQPSLARYPGPQFPVVSQDLTQASAAIAPTYIFPMPQPNLAWWPGRIYPDVPRQLTGATIQQTYIFTMPLPNLSWWPGPQFPLPPPQFTQVFVAAQTYIFSMPLPYLPAWPKPQPSDAIRQVTGATIQRTDPIARFGDPLLALYPGRQFPGAIAQLHQGALKQQTYIFPMPLPNLSWWPGRVFACGLLPFDGVVVALLYPNPEIFRNGSTSAMPQIFREDPDADE